ncbi:hypothetical protein G7Z17_g12542 [Cylindrodendrum hubeiense]|uniref:Uncharacterized protein n=1 Tax=Cylindrodendrum hubeiense TaxID=595255 RepID=A0A9P5GYT5_9HYPO|nr:hypothetical protein G7Z17_g12542 [Cylindrodendrum hubeiense]
MTPWPATSNPRLRTLSPASAAGAPCPCAGKIMPCRLVQEKREKKKNHGQGEDWPARARDATRAGVMERHCTAGATFCVGGATAQALEKD